MSEEKKIICGRELTCILCKHFRLEEYQRGYSEWTPSSPMGMLCVKGVWCVDREETTQAGFRSMMLSAQTCRDFRRYDKD